MEKGGLGRRLRRMIRRGRKGGGGAAAAAGTIKESKWE